MQDGTNTGNGERRTENGEPRTENREPGTGTGVWELVYSGNPLNNLIQNGGRRTEDLKTGCRRRQPHHTTPSERLHVPYMELGVAIPHIQSHHHLLAILVYKGEWAIIIFIIYIAQISIQI